MWSLLSFRSFRHDFSRILTWPACHVTSNTFPPTSLITLKIMSTMKYEKKQKIASSDRSSNNITIDALRCLMHDETASTEKVMSITATVANVLCSEKKDTFTWVYDRNTLLRSWNDNRFFRLSGMKTKSTELLNIVCRAFSRTILAKYPSRCSPLPHKQFSWSQPHISPA